MTVSELRTLVDNLDEYIHIPGGIDRLKKMVLHLAVSGQLVPQDSSEGTGEELFQRIQAEKQELIKRDKLKKQKLLPEIDHSELSFSIPSSWKWALLGDIIQLQSGADLVPSQYNDNSYGVPYITGASNIDNGSILINRWTNSPKNIALKGDLLITCKGTIGTMAFLKDEKVHIARQIMAVRFNTLLESEYIKHVISTNVEKLKDSAQSIIPGIARDDMLTMPVPLPPLAEQKRIVAKVDSIFALINQLAEAYKSEQTERSKLVASSLVQLAKAENDVEDSLALTHLSEIVRTKADAKVLRQTILHLAVSGQLVPQDSYEGTGEELYLQIQVEKQELIKRGKLKKQKPLPAISEVEAPFTTPNSWKWARLGDLSDIFNGNSINASEKKLRYEKVIDGYPYIATKDIGYGFENVDYENGVKIPFNEDKFKIISEGTALICAEGGSAGKKCGIVDRDVAFGNKMYAFKAFGGLILPEFVLYNYLSKQFYEQFSGKMAGIIGGISTASFKQLLMPLPSLAEQKRIVAKTTQLLDLVSELEKHLEK